MLDRFKNSVTNIYAATWSEAIEARILKQSIPFVENNFPYGSFNDPLISFNTNTNNIPITLQDANSHLEVHFTR